jgi:uncharacterized membrane protein YedE/YeeE
MTEFTPLSAAIGGALIGLSAVLLMMLAGRVAGITGILDGALALQSSERGWRLAFIAGLVLAPVTGLLAGLPIAVPAMPASWIVIVAAGLLVGFGTRLANGCTSGHGICGIARLSPRSLVATGVFMAVAVVTVAVVRHGG